MFSCLQTRRFRRIFGGILLTSSCLVFWPLPCWSAKEGEFNDYASARPVTLSPPVVRETDARLKKKLPANTPAYFRKTYLSLMRAPLPAKIYNQGGIPQFVPKLEIDKDPLGLLGTYQPKGATETKSNAFFQSLGTNGRSCVTCHQPPSGMSVSVRNIKKRLYATRGKDPIFAPVDGANCPNQVRAKDTSGSPVGGRKGKGMKAFKDAHSLLINKGLIRIALPVPANAEYTIKVVSDPTTCNIDPVFAKLPDGTRIVSVFRRPLITANLNFKTTTIFPAPNGNSGNIMWDGREPTLFTQAVSATMGHAQALKPPSREQQKQIVDFETKIFSAQYIDKKAGLLTDGFATGGPVVLSGVKPGQGNLKVINAYDAWLTASGKSAAKRQSIARGQVIFNGKLFTIANVAGFNDLLGIDNPAPDNTCSTCHNAVGAASDVRPRSQVAIGLNGDSFAFNGDAAANDLPKFKITCNVDDQITSPVDTNGFIFSKAGDSVVTNDPGLALITGKCKHVGLRTVPSLRGLAAHEPFFSNGSAPKLDDVVKFYNKRFSIGLTVQEQTDLVNFLGAL